MKKNISPIARIGLLIFIGQIIISSFIKEIPYWLEVAVLLIGIVMIMLGMFKVKSNKSN